MDNITKLGNQVFIFIFVDSFIHSAGIICSPSHLPWFNIKSTSPEKNSKHAARNPKLSIATFIFGQSLLRWVFLPP
jgi:hypothetical protein